MTTVRESTVWEALGVTPVINAMGCATVLGGSTLSPGVMQALEAANHYYADMKDLLLKTGEMIAPLVGAEAALITAGSATAINLGTAACMSGSDREKIERLPNAEGMRNEVVMFQRMKAPELGYRYWRCHETVGAKLVLVGTDESGSIEDMERAVGPNTAAIHYLPRAYKRGGLPPAEEVIALGKRLDVPVFVDAAGETYPLDELSRYARAGADLVTYGGKYFRGPHSTGILCGRRDLIEAASLHTFIGFQYGTLGIGRAMKLERQEVVAAVEALREWLGMNHEERLMADDARVRHIEEALRDIPGVRVTRCATAMAEVGEPLPEHGGPAGSMIIHIDPQVVGKTAAEAAGELRAGNPSIWAIVTRPGLVSMGSVGSADGIGLTMVCLLEGQEKVIAERLRSVLSG